MFSPLEQFEVIKLLNFFTNGWDLSLVSTVLPLILLNIFTFVFINVFMKNFTILPNTWQAIFEINFKFIASIVKQQVGNKGFVYLPIMFTVFNFILICNLLSLVPFGIAITSHIVLIIFLTITFCLSIFIIGLLTHKLKFLRIFIPECPLLLLPILIPIEIFSYFIRMFSLAIRLTANIFAGHTLVYIISSFILSVTSIKGLFFLASVIPLLMIILLEFGVAFLQAYVFTILLCIYLSDSLIFPSH